MSNTDSLDALLQQIQSKSDLQLHEAVPDLPVRNPSSGSLPGSGAGVPDAVAMRATPVSGSETEQNDMWQSNLTPRQRSLPKISSKMLGGLVAVMVLMVGVGAATVLTQNSQDLRQQASEGSVEVSGPSVTLTQDEYEAQFGAQDAGTVDGTNQGTQGVQGLLERDWTSFEIIVVVAAVGTVVFLLGFVIWVFLV